MWLLRDTATWRDFGWLLTDAVAGFLTGMMPFVLIGYAAFGLLLPTGLWVPIVEATGTYFFCFVPVNSWFTALLAAGLSAVMIVLGLRAAVAAQGLHLEASMLGKWKATVQFVAIALVMLRPDVVIGGVFLDQWVLVAAAVVTAWSGVDYFMSFSSALHGDT